MQQECRYICQRAANAIISEVGSYRVSTDALHGINQFLDEFLVRLLSHAQSLDLSRIKTSVFHLLPSTLGKNAIVEAELEVKTFTETEVIDYDVYEKMRSLGAPSFPLSQCLPLLRDKCFEFCTLADKDDQQSWIPQQQQCSIVISPIVAIYVTTVLEHMAEYILTAVAMTAETEDTDYVRIKELFLALIDDMQVGLVFQAMDLRDKMEKRTFPHGYVSRSSMLPPPTTTSRQDHPRNSSNSMNPGNSFLGDIVFDDLELNYDDDEVTSVQQQRPSGTHSSLSNYSMTSNNRHRPLSMMTNSTSQTSFSGTSSNKKAYKVFKNDHTSPLASEPAAYDPDSPTMNFEDLIRSGNTMRVSLTPHRLKSIEVKDQMVDEPAPAKPAWKRRSSSVPRMSTSSSSSRPQTPTLPHPHHHRSPSPLVSDSTMNDYAITQRSMSPPPIKSKTTTDHRFEQPREAPKPPLSSATSTSGKSIEKSLPTPTSSTSSRQSKHRAPVPMDMKTSSLSESTITTSTSTSSPNDTSEKAPTSTREKAKSPSSTSSSTTSSIATPTGASTKPKTLATATPRPPTLRRGSLSNRKSRENLRRQREKDAKSSSTEPKTDSTTTTLTERRDSSASSNSSKQQQKAARPSKSTPDLTENHQSSSTDSLDSLDPDHAKQSPSTTNDSGIPQRPSSYVAKRASMAGASRRQSLHESYAITVTEPSTDTTSTTNKDATLPTPSPRSHSAAAAGTVGNTIKQLDQVVKQKSSAASMQAYSRKSSTTSLTSADSTDPTLSVPPKSASRKSAVLDRVLQFERAYSLDDTASSQQRRASSYIPRRERFMYLQRDPNALEKKSTTSISTTSSSASAAVRPGTSAAIAAAAARFASGVSMAIQTDPPTNPLPPSLTITDDAGNDSHLHHHASSLTSTTNKQNDNDDLVSEHGVMDGDEEWFLPEDEWEDVHEQENAVAEWLLGEA